ncbi:MAG: hypothetical protein M3N52_13510, partial [Actinomycetota bacterium]|nr:hypothetical protein [Actinomycetota bacterium]
MPSVLGTAALRRAVVALAVVAGAACAPAQAAPTDLRLGRPSSLPAVAIAARLSGSVDGLPDLTGASRDVARERLLALG